MVALLVVMTILICVCVDGVVQRRKAKREIAARRLAAGLLPAEQLAVVSAPANVFLDTGHTWVKVSPQGRADVGLDGFAQTLIGRVDAVVLPEVGAEVHRGDMLFAVRQDNRRAAFASPVDGVVTEVDKDLNWRPEALADDPYSEGWVCSIAPKNLAHDLKELKTADEALDWLRGETERFRELFASRPVHEMPIGGAPRDSGILEAMDDETWAKFTELFLRRRPRTEH
jgi:glycine cleavage system H lipoate-binding protein